jgi:heptosyltransferase-2
MKKRILIIQTAFIGDVILTLPIVKVLKENYQNCKIDFLCIPQTSNLLENNPNIIDVIVYDKKGTDKGVRNLFKIIKTVRRGNYDLILTPHRSFRSAIVSFFSNCKKTVSFDKSSVSFLYTNRVEYIERSHEIIRNLKLLEQLGINETEIIKPDLYPNEKDKCVVDDFFKKFGITKEDKFITIAPGSAWFTKRFPKEKFIRLLDYLDENEMKILLIGGKDDYELCERILNSSVNKNVCNLSGELSLLQSAELIKRARLLITNDSAALHIANSVDTNVIAIFGATVPAFGFYPYGRNDVVFEINGLYCRPCAIHGGNKCSIKTFDCMIRIDEEEIYKTVLKMLF